MQSQRTAFYFWAYNLIKGDLVYGHNNRIIWNFLGFEDAQYASNYTLVVYIKRHYSFILFELK